MPFYVDSPLRVPLSSKKDFILNLNKYRNTHFKTLNRAKAIYKKEMEKQIDKLPVMEKILCVYTVYPGTKRKFDVGNVCSIHEKFFCDALVEYGKLPDDNYEHMPDTVYRYGSLDRDNPRVEIEITEIV